MALERLEVVLLLDTYKIGDGLQAIIIFLNTSFIIIILN